MALVKCKECGKEVSSEATACIHCGCPRNSFNDNANSESNCSGKKRNYIFYVLIAAAILGAGAYLYYKHIAIDIAALEGRTTKLIENEISMKMRVPVVIKDLALVKKGNNAFGGVMNVIINEETSTRCVTDVTVDNDKILATWSPVGAPEDLNPASDFTRLVTKIKLGTGEIFEGQSLYAATRVLSDCRKKDFGVDRDPKRYGDKVYTTLYICKEQKFKIVSGETASGDDYEVRSIFVR